MIDAFSEQGFRVIRFDKKSVPDAIAIDFDNKKITAIEACTTSSNIFMTKMKYENNTDFDEKIIGTKKILVREKTERITHGGRKFKSYKAYILALELRKQGMTERKIQSEIMKQLNEKVSSGIVHYWVSGQVVK